jgi:hypothetical protein
MIHAILALTGSDTEYRLDSFQLSHRLPRRAALRFH